MDVGSFRVCRSILCHLQHIDGISLDTSRLGRYEASNLDLRSIFPNLRNLSKRVIFKISRMFLGVALVQRVPHNILTAFRRERHGLGVRAIPAETVSSGEIAGARLDSSVAAREASHSRGGAARRAAAPALLDSVKVAPRESESPSQSTQPRRAKTPADPRPVEVARQCQCNQPTEPRRGRKPALASTPAMCPSPPRTQTWAKVPTAKPAPAPCFPHRNIDSL